MTNVASDLEGLTADLGQLQRLVGKSGGGGWTPILREISARLSRAEEREAALQELKQYFGGMGSLNDIFLCEVNDNVPSGYTAVLANQELNSLLDRVFREVSLFGASAEERSEWLAWEASAVPPPRIQNAFRERR